MRRQILRLFSTQVAQKSAGGLALNALRFQKAAKARNFWVALAAGSSLALMSSMQPTSLADNYEVTIKADF